MRALESIFKIEKHIVLALLCTTVMACSHSLHEVHVSDISPGSKLDQAKTITAESEQFVILGFVGQTDYVNDARRKLMDKCPRGRIEGVTTQYLTDLGFFSWTNKILMKGSCLNAG